MNIMLDALPSVSLVERSVLPDASAVYFVMSGERVLYIGHARRLVMRWRAHHRFSQFSKIGNIRIAWLLADESILEELEDDCIQQFNPLLNWTSVEDDRTHKRTVAFPPDLYARLTEIADAEERDVTSQIVKVLRDFIARYEKEKASGPKVPQSLAQPGMVVQI